MSMTDLRTAFNVSVRTRLPIAQTQQGRTVMTQWVSFDNLSDGKEHVAIIYGEADRQERPVVRLHSECLSGDTFDAQTCDCGAQLEYARNRMQDEGGILLYLRQEGRGIGLYQKMAAMQAQQVHGLDTYAANVALGHGEDERDFGVAAQMLGALGVRQVRLLTGNPDKIAALQRHGIDVVEAIAPPAFETLHNHAYLKAKRGRGHNL